MLFRKAKIDDVKELKDEIERLEKERNDLNKQVAQLKLDKKMEVENIKHLTKLKEEKDKLATERLKVQMEGEKNQAIAVVKDEYRDKTEQQLTTERDNMKEMYNEILKRLPNINVEGKLK